MTRRRWQCFQESGTLAGHWFACAMIASVGISGCKTGGMGTSLSWWPGAGGKDANAKLASASGSDDGVKKPSETQSPYPTTSTPESYALDGAKPALTPPSAAPATPAMVAATPPGPITYGATPPPAAVPPAAAATAVTTPSSSPASSGAIAAQVGSYQGWPAAGGAAAPVQTASAPVQPASAPVQPPPSQFQSATAAVAASPTPPPVASSEPAAPVAPPQERYADARFADPSAMPAASQPPAAASRYGGADASQFGSGFGGTATAATAASSPTTRFDSGLDPDPGLGPNPAPTSVASPAASASSIEPASDASSPAVGQPPSSSPPPGTSPTRRPDSGYRPGGTSNYRPSQAIIDEPSDDAAVRQVSFESPVR